MKVLLDATAVSKLLALDPVATGDLAKNAASQVATEITRRLTRAAIEAHLDSFLANEMIEGSWYQKTIATKYRKLLEDAMNKIASAFLTQVTDGTINKLIVERVNETWQQISPTLADTIKNQVDQMIRERFAVAFGDKK